MLELKVTVELPGIPEALNNLAHALMNQAIGHVDLNDPAPSPAAEALEENRRVIQMPKPEEPKPESPVSPLEMEAIEVVTETKPEEPKPEQKPEEPKPEAKKPSYTFDQISRAGADLCSKGMIKDLTELLNTKYKVQAITQLRPEQYDAIAEDLIAKGAQF